MRTTLARLIGCTLLLVAQASLADLKPGQPTVLITGANRGIGLEYVKQIAARGWNVIATTRNPDEATELQALAKNNPGVVIEKLDVTDHPAIDALAARYKDQPIDLLINNAAVTPRLKTAFSGKTAMIDYEVARKSFETNALGAIKVASTFLPHVIASQQKKIVFISSKGGSFAEGPKGPIMFEYRASKAALNMLVYSFSYETKGKGVTTIALSPGSVNTEPAPGEFGYGSKIRQPGAIEPPESVSAMLKVIDGLSAAQNGQFLDYKDGRVIPW
ncbi:MAG: SDR family oxidoreductase [Chromatiales bacterium]|nr:SDR family oxidoreductase [Chromatiales bacterium]